MKSYVFKTVFNDSRKNFYDIVNAENIDDAYEKANAVVKCVDEKGFGTDVHATASIVCELASLYIE